jgi:acylphosphatase
MAFEARAHVRVKGRVQGVGFRFATADEARRLDLRGWVRNLDSGEVEAVFEGRRERVVEMVRWCEEGPPGSYVRDVHVSWDEPAEQLSPSSFEIRPTSIG